jgi:hypothetical protein
MESPGRRRESTVARWLLVVTRGRCVLKNRSGGRPLVLEARNEALRLVDDQSVAVAGAAEARLFGPHRHGARARVLWARAPALTFAQPRSGDRGPFWTSWPGRKRTDSHKPHPAFSCRLFCLLTHSLCVSLCYSPGPARRSAVFQRGFYKLVMKAARIHRRHFLLKPAAWRPR